MRIEHAGDAANRAAGGWQEAASVEAGRIARRIAIGPDGATAPAVIQADTVRISAEARAVAPGALHAGAGGPPAPGDVIGAVRAVLMAGTPAEVRGAVERLGAVLRRSTPMGKDILSEPPGRLLRVAAMSVAAVEVACGGSASRVMRAANLVRALAAPLPGEVLAGERLLERAGAALYLAAGWRAMEGDATWPAVMPAAAGETGELPAALLSLAGAPGHRRRSRGRGKPGGRGLAGGDGDGSGADSPGQTEVDREPRGFV